MAQPGRQPGGVGPQSSLREAEAPAALARGPYLGVEHLVQRGAAAQQPVHQRQPQAQGAVVDVLHEDDLRHDQHRVPHVAAELARHACPQGSASAGGLSQSGPAMGSRAPRHLPGHMPSLSQPAVTMATPPSPGGGAGTEEASPFREWRGGRDGQTHSQSEGKPCRPAARGPPVLRLPRGSLTGDRLEDPKVRARPGLPHRPTPGTVLTDRTMEERPYQPREAKLLRPERLRRLRRKEAFPGTAAEGRDRGCAGAVGAGPGGAARRGCARASTGATAVGSEAGGS